MSSKQYIQELERLMEIFTDLEILPKSPSFEDHMYQKAQQALEHVENVIGQAKESDYFKCSRERFLHSIILSLKNVPSGGKILDVGNAPGYLAIGLDYLGYKVNGINLNKEWETTYSSKKWLSTFNVQAVDIERPPLPYSDNQFDGIIFTEVLEHIAITHPEKILLEFRRILNNNGTLVFSTPNVCNISNILALLTGRNVFWSPNIFYGSTDRHNREYTPDEVYSLFTTTGFKPIDYYGMNDHANWREGANELVYELLSITGHEHSLIRNTIIGAFKNQ